MSIEVRSSVRFWKGVMLFLVAWVGVVHGALQPASIFSNGAVLQRERRVPVWGVADPGKTVTVEFAGQSVSTEVDAAGKWMLYLQPLTTSTSGAVMTIRTDTESVTLNDLLVGEVWLCSGQSNMGFSMKYLFQEERELEYQPYGDFNRKVADEYEDPFLRMNPVRTAASPLEPLYDYHLKRKNVTVWTPVTPKINPSLNATAFYFGKELREALGNVPVGLIIAAFGGKPIEPFIPPSCWQSTPELAEFYAQSQPMFEEYRAYLANKEACDKAFQEYRLAVAEARKNKTPLPPRPALPMDLSHEIPGAIYNGMIAQLVPYAMRGVIWYQGESNATRDEDRHAAHFVALIQSWRQVWGQGDFPFYYCQLPGFAGMELRKEEPFDKSGWSTVSDAQRRALALPGTGMAVLKDIGQPLNIHPLNKADVGKRLALWALAKDYGQDVPAYTGPLYREARKEGARVLIRFDHAGSGLSAGAKPVMQPVQLSDGSIDGFQICGPDRKWTWATVEVIGPDMLVVSSAEVTNPVEVRYGWKGYSDRFNFYNKEGLPAAVFTTGLLTE